LIFHSLKIDIILPLLQINNLQVNFVNDGKTSNAVEGISLEVKKGEILAIVGESGSGKSVTSLSILRLIPAPPAVYPKGDILFSEDGLNSINLLQTDDKTLQSIRGNKIAMIFQEPMTSLNPVFTCGNQVIESIMQHQAVSAKEAREKVIRLFEKVKLPDPARIFNRYPHQLSGGQKQRVMIAMALAGDPALLICDEPTTALDVTVQKTILELIKTLQAERQMGVIFITHDLGVVAEIADRAIVMYKGKMVEEGTVQQLFTRPMHPYTKGLLACRPVLHPKGTRLPVVSDFWTDGVAATKERPVTRQPGTAASPSTIPLLRINDLKVWFPAKKTWLGKVTAHVKAVDGISFEVYKGETLGLVGESGCGKTTLGRALLRLIKPSAGNILYNNIDLAGIKNTQLRAMRKEMQIIFQDPYSSLNPRITIGEALTEPLKVHRILLKAAQRKDKVIELLEQVNLEAAHFNRYPHEFSGGQRQRIVIARALTMNPSFIVCDESVSALDVSVQAQVLNLLNDLKASFGFTAIFISHDLGVVRYISDRIMVMNKGKIEETGTAEEVYHHPKNSYTQELIAAIPKGITPAY
jgi:peptide/nickel transport system ATP-binding protein